jgi:hypothetical protein
VRAGIVDEWPAEKHHASYARVPAEENSMLSGFDPYLGIPGATTESRPMANYGFCTIATRSHFKYAVALATSLQRYHPGLTLCVLLLDFDDDWRIDRSPSIEVFRLEEIRVADIEDMKIYFNAFELSNCLKPFFIAHLLDNGFDKLVYLDADILAVGCFDGLFRMLNRYSFVLSPHWLCPKLVQNSEVSVSNIADFGIYNGGMWGIRQKGGKDVLIWLMQFLPTFGFDDRKSGMCCDQKLLPLAAQLFIHQFGCIQHPGYNVAYWNLHERGISKDENRYMVNGRPAIFFHLSGFRAEHQETFSRHSSWNFERLPILKDIVSEYLSYIPAELATENSYAYDYVGSQKLTTELRRYYFVHRTFAGYSKAEPRGRIRRWLRLC